MSNSVESGATPICPCPDDECLRPNGPDCQKPLTLDQRLALLNAVMIGCPNAEPRTRSAQPTPPTQAGES